MNERGEEEGDHSSDIELSEIQEEINNNKFGENENINIQNSEILVNENNEEIVVEKNEASEIIENTNTNINRIEEIEITDPSNSPLIIPEIEDSNEKEEEEIGKTDLENINKEPTETQILWKNVKDLVSFSSLLTLIFACGIVGLGTLNTLSAKIQDENVAKGYGPAPPIPYHHPFTQTMCMFCGEILCLPISYIPPLFSCVCSYVTCWCICKKLKKKKKVKISNNNNSNSNYKKNKKSLNPIYLMIPSLLDLTGTTLTNVGLILTYASVYQMMRGLAIPANCLLSVLLLKSRRYFHHWFGIFMILIGLFIVGLYSYLSSESSDAASPFFGSILVLIAQLFTAMQYIVEEKILGTNPDANVFRVVGWEGFYGVTQSLILLFVLYLIPGTDFGGRFENFPYAVAQIYNDSDLIMFVVFYVFSITWFNICGINITKRVSSTSRATINSLRTISIWIVQLIRGKEKFSFVQLLGFVVLVVGTFLYNEVIQIPIYKNWLTRRKIRNEEKDVAKKLRKEEMRLGKIEKKRIKKLEKKKKKRNKDKSKDKDNMKIKENEFEDEIETENQIKNHGVKGSKEIEKVIDSNKNEFEMEDVELTMNDEKQMELILIGEENENL